MSNDQLTEAHPRAKLIGQALGAIILTAIAVPSVTLWTSSPEDTAILSHGYCSSMKINVLAVSNKDQSQKVLAVASIADDAAKLGISLDQLATSCAESTATDNAIYTALSSIKYSFLKGANRSREEEKSAGI